MGPTPSLLDSMLSAAAIYAPLVIASVSLVVDRRSQLRSRESRPAPTFAVVRLKVLALILALILPLVLIAGGAVARPGSADPTLAPLVLVLTMVGAVTQFASWLLLIWSFTLQFRASREWRMHERDRAA